MNDLVSTGERWFAVESAFEDELPQYWGEWGVASEVGELASILLRRPGPEIEAISDPQTVRWLDRMDATLAREQHDRLATIYRDHGATVHYVERMPDDRANALFVRDCVAMTPEGAIVGRPAIPARRGEERFVAETLARLGIPIIRTISGCGVFEGADLMWVDRRTVILGVGNRSNREGLRQVEEVLRTMGVDEVLYFQIPYGQAHIDGLFNLADWDKAVFFPWQTPFEVINTLRKRGFQLIEVTSPHEAKRGMATNFVCLSPGKVVMPAGNPIAEEQMSKAGIEIIALDVSELQKGWGAIHCMSAALSRREG